MCVVFVLGSAYVYVSLDQRVTWTELCKLLASDGAAGNQFGRSVAIYANTIVIVAQYGANSGTS